MNSLNWPLPIFLIGLTAIFLLSCASIESEKAYHDEACSQRFSGFNVDLRNRGNEVMRTQNFILTESADNRPGCARQIANETRLGAFRDYFIGLANYFDFGNQAAYIKAYEALSRFGNQRENCVRKIDHALDAFNHADCSAPFLMEAFLLLETDNRVFRQHSGKAFRLDQAHHLFFELQKTYAVLPALIRTSLDEGGPPQSLLIGEDYIDTYANHIWKLFNELSYRIVKTAEATSGGDFTVFGNAVGSTGNDQTFWTDSKFNEYGRAMVKIHRDYLLDDYYREAELEAGNYFGDNPASYCEGRLFILDLIHEGNYERDAKRNSMLYRNCVKYHESRW